ncbi:MAG: hypothetical protein ACFB9N_06465 [Geitlerinemataceae cyanobacterium]
MRFSCGFAIGLILPAVSGFRAFSAIGLVFAAICGLLSWRQGDRFWHWLSRHLR